MGRDGKVVFGAGGDEDRVARDVPDIDLFIVISAGGALPEEVAIRIGRWIPG